MNETDKIKNLVTILNNASNSYYNSGYAIMSDEEFDLLLKELKDLENKTGIVLSNSPTQHVGAKVTSKLEKIQHERPMLSLDKCHTVQELIDFAEEDECYLSIKCDGLTTRLIYENGELVSAETRGDGETGQQVLFHVKQYVNVPTHIPVDGKYIIDGESVIFLSDFELINSTLPEDKKFANSRNLASGTLSNLDSNITKQRNMKFIAWRVIEGDDIDGHFYRLRNAEDLGFTISPMRTFTNKYNSKEQLDGMLHGLRKYANQIGLPMDGIVMAKNSHIKAESMGRTSKFFRHSISYKFEDELYETKLTGVEFTIGKTGCLTPTATFKPVIIDGATVERASLTNLSIIKKLGLTNNCTVFVRKANCIIPQITRALQDGDSEIKIPNVCPICNGKTAVIKDNESEVLICTNEKCKGKLLGKLKFFVSKPAANIDGLSESTLDFLINKGWVKTFKDIYHLYNYQNEWEKCDGFGKKSVEKILSAIEKSRNIDLAHFICSLSIPNIGLSAAKTIAKHFNDSYKEFMNSYFYWHFDWTNLEDFGFIMAESINSYLYDNFEEVNELANEMNFVIPEKPSITDNPFNGKSICVTGKLNHFTRDSINEKIISLGARAASSVTAKTDYLITNEASGSSKYKKAVELNIPIITEEEFLNMLED